MAAKTCGQAIEAGKQRRGEKTGLVALGEIGRPQGFLLCDGCGHGRILPAVPPQLLNKVALP